MSLLLVTKYGSKIGNMIFSPLGERAVKVAGIVPWIQVKTYRSPFSLWDLEGKALLTPVRKEAECQFKCH